MVESIRHQSDKPVLGGDRFALTFPYAMISDRPMDKHDRPTLPLFLIGEIGIIDPDLLYLRRISAG
jgi:hypothetical protein